MLIGGIKGDVEESLVQMSEKEWEELGTKFPETSETDEFRLLMGRN